MSAKANKEKVLHTRVPESLDAQIKALANALRVPVSSLVRNILEDSVAVIDTVRDLSERARADAQSELRRGWTEFQTILAESFKSRANVPAREAVALEDASALFPDVLGWQALALNVRAACARCEIDLQPGDTAHLGVRDGVGPRVIICGACLPRGV